MTKGEFYRGNAASEITLRLPQDCVVACAELGRSNIYLHFCWWKTQWCSSNYFTSLHRSTLKSCYLPAIFRPFSLFSFLDTPNRQNKKCWIRENQYISSFVRMEFTIGSHTTFDSTLKGQLGRTNIYPHFFRWNTQLDLILLFLARPWRLKLYFPKNIYSVFRTSGKWPAHNSQHMTYSWAQYRSWWDLLR